MHYNLYKALIILPLIMAAAFAGETDPNANLLRNEGAEEGNASVPASWFKAYLPAEGLTMYRDPNIAHSGKYSLAISNTHKYEQIVCNNWAQDIHSVSIGSVVNVNAYIKVENAECVNVCLQCWGVKDTDCGEMLAFASTNILRGDSDWVLWESSPVLVPPGTVKMTVRAALTGIGKVWFDDFSINTLEITNEDKHAIFDDRVGNKKYEQKQIQEHTAEYFFSRLGHSEPEYHGFAGMWALIEKATISDEQTKENIVLMAGDIIKDPNQTAFRRWQCGYILGSIGDAKGISSLIAALTQDLNATIRCGAACALGKFKDKPATDALKQAEATEINPVVLKAIHNALMQQIPDK